MIIASGVSTGIGVSRAKVFKTDSMELPLCSADSVSSELYKIDYCIKKACDELRVECDSIGASVNNQAAGVFNKYAKTINNPQLMNDIKEKVINEGVTAEFAIDSIMCSFNKIIEGLDDEYLYEKTEDIEEIRCRLLSKLVDFRSIDYTAINEECIVVTDRLTPKDILGMNPMYVKGIVTITGGPTSSSGIMARRMNIPAVTGVGYEGRHIKNGDVLIVDGNNGKVIINPDDGELVAYGVRIYSY